jgi:hypothetical protein
VARQPSPKRSLAGSCLAYTEGLATVIAHNDEDGRDAAATHAAAERLADTLRPFASQGWVRDWAHPTSAEVHGYLDVAGAYRTADATVNHDSTEVTVELCNLLVAAAVQVFRALEVAAALDAVGGLPRPAPRRSPRRRRPPPPIEPRWSPRR